jgi:DNA polymerase III subunit epsilon
MTIGDIQFTVFDTETTGLDPRSGDRMVELAGVRIVGGEIREEESFHSLINPQRPVSPGAARIHGISENDLQDAPTAEQVLPSFIDFVGDSLLIAHNAEFDLGFLNAEKELCWGYIDIPECFCTLAMSRSLFPQEYRHNLDAVVERLGIQKRKAHHRALSDVLLTAQAFLSFVDSGKIATIDRLREIAAPKTRTVRARRVRAA